MWVKVCLVGVFALLTARADASTGLELTAPALVDLAAAGPVPKARALDGRLADASERVRRGEGRQVVAQLLALPEALAQTPAARFLLAEALFQSRRYEEAAPAYEALLLSSPLLADRARLHLGESLLRTGRPGDAAAVLGDVGEGAPEHDEALRLRAEALLVAGQAEEVRELLAPWRAPREGPRAELLLLLAQAHEALGDPGAARHILGLLVLDHPSSPRAREAAQRIAGLTAENEAAKARSWRRLAGALGRRDGGSQVAALGRLGALAATASFVRAKLALESGNALAAIPHLAEAATLAEADGNRELMARARFTLGESLRERGRLGPAAEAWERMAADVPEHPLAPEALLAAAEVRLRLRQYEAGERNLTSLLLLHPVHSDRPRALFFMGWSLLRQERAERAAEFFATAAREAPERAAREFEPGAGRIAAAARSMYWAARALGASGRQDTAQAGYRLVLTRFPLSYYAELARAQLEDGDGVGLLVTEPLDDAAPDPRLQRARDAAGLGWRREALAALRPVLMDPSQVRRGEDLIAMADLTEALGSVGAARALFREAVVRHGASLAPAEQERAWRRAFPRLHGTLIEQEAERQDISPWLLYGLVLRESGFVSCAASRVGARGLAQLMMPAAQDAARDLGLAAPTEEALCDPAYNLRLGAWHLRKLLRHFGGSEVLALAAYNAGAGSVARWIASSGDLPVDAFVEEIPYQETRTYVRTVLSAARAYAWIYGEPGTSGAGASLGDIEGKVRGVTHSGPSDG